MGLFNLMVASTGPLGVNEEYGDIVFSLFPTAAVFKSGGRRLVLGARDPHATILG